MGEQCKAGRVKARVAGASHALGNFVDYAVLIGNDLFGVGRVVRVKSVQFIQTFQDQ